MQWCVVQCCVEQSCVVKWCVVWWCVVQCTKATRTDVLDPGSCPCVLAAACPRFIVFMIGILMI